ncbi:hypothetical protein F5B20DRAFT_530004 [Whalleya microplaca]|nr:hypothetical protein F5B20DRAFT_530004 [Whalleya microplaca]
MNWQEKQGNASSSNLSSNFRAPEIENPRPSYHNGTPPSRPSRALTRTVSEVRDGIESRRDLEHGPPVEEEDAAALATTAIIPPDPNLVTWLGPGDPRNPRNWALSRKWTVVFIVSTFTLISPVSSSMVAPSLTAIGEELDIPQACKSDFERLRAQLVPLPGFYQITDTIPV